MENQHIGLDTDTTTSQNEFSSTVYPATYFKASAGVTFRHFLPITTASSTSQSKVFPCSRDGIQMSSPGLIAQVLAFINTTGFDGRGTPRFFALSS